MQNPFRRWAAAGWIAASVAVPLGGALGQTPPSDTLPPVRLDSIAVTAVRTPFDAVRVPYAVAVVRAPEVARGRPGLALDEALRLVPGVQVDNRFNYALGERIAIRGFGARSAFGVRGIRVLLDGIPLTLPDGQTNLNGVDPSTLGRVEVLRGAASAIYGGNAAGGAILLQSAVPDGVRARVLGGPDGLRRAEAGAGGRVGAARWGVQLSDLRYAGYRDWSDAENLRGTALLRSGGWRVVANGVRYQARNPGSLTDTALARDRTQAFRVNRARETGERGEQGQLGASWTGSMGPAGVEIGGYALGRSLDNPIPARYILLDRVAGGARALARMERRLAGQTFRVQVGAEAEAQRDERRNFPFLGTGPTRSDSAVLDQRERVRSAAGFGQLAASFADRLDLLASIRHDRYRFAVRDRLIGPRNPDDSGVRTFGQTSPSLGASLRVAEALHLYGNLSTAFETPTTTELANRPTGAGGFNPSLQPQRTRSGELGAKGRLGDWATYEAAVYRARVRDELISFEVPGAPGRQFYRNAGSTEREGFEAGLALRPAAWVRAQASYTRTDARFRDFRVVSGRDTAVFDGNRLPGVAPERWTGLLSLSLAKGAYAELDARWVAATPTNDANLRGTASPAYRVLDARLGATDLRLGRTTLEPVLGITNLLDERYNASVVINAFGRRFFEPGPGRALYLGAAVGFGGGR